MACAFGCEIVNCDASQLYIGMDIGTAKPDSFERAAAPHHLFDVAYPDSPLNAGVWLAMAQRKVAEISARGRLPLVVGGTGLYMRALLHGLADIPAVRLETQKTVRERIHNEGPQALHAELAQVDPESAGRIKPTDPQRISRALEVYLETGTPISHFQNLHRFGEERYDALVLCMTLPAAELKGRIEERVPRMFDSGFPKEVERLLKLGYSPSLQTFKALGYREVAAFLNGDISRDQAMQRVAIRHSQYSKRQRTWFQNELGMHRFAPNEVGSMETLVSRWTEKV